METIEKPTAKKTIHIALAGNPNTGKSSLFNALTGLKQKVGNFPGVTVDKKTGKYKSPNGNTVLVTDLPGTYSLNPKSEDEKVTCNYVGKSPDNEAILVIADGTNLKRNLLLCTQLIDKKKPVILVLNMMDLVQKTGLKIDLDLLQKELGIPVVPVNARISKGIENLKNCIENFEFKPNNIFFQQNDFFSNEDTLERYKQISKVIDKTVIKLNDSTYKGHSEKLDNILTHKVWGFVIFFAILFIVFQVIFSWATYPMEWIQLLFLKFGSLVSTILPQGLLNNLIVNGIIAGLSGIVVFIPQIALLFFFLGILEDTGYMARVSFIMDRVLRPVGLNGRSVIPLLSGAACAVPAIMSARTISDPKERLITIFVTPLITCSARIPVYVLLISMLVPATAYWGIFNLQGIFMLFMYFLGFFAAIGTAWVMKLIFKPNHKNIFLMEMPIYRTPRWSSIGLDMFNKVKIFLFKVGKIVIAISIVLWVLSTFGPPKKMDKIENHYASLIQRHPDKKDVLTTKLATTKLENSYAGMFGKFIEPAIKPLGFDWKIGISLITSFAAREAFVGTMATIYSVGDKDNTESIKDKMTKAVNPQTGEKVYSVGTILALLVFYAFAMQCMTTLATVKRETATWKWPIIQTIYMGGLAYFAALFVFQVFS